MNQTIKRVVTAAVGVGLIGLLVISTARFFSGRRLAPAPAAVENASRTLRLKAAATEDVDSAGGVKLSAADPTTRARVEEGYGKLPMSFELNTGHYNKKVKYVTRGSGYTLFLAEGEAVLSLARSEGKKQDRYVGKRGLPGTQAWKAKGTWQKRQAAVLRMRFEGANPQTEVQGENQQESKRNYFIGNDPAKWRTDVATYGKVRYRGLYHGIDFRVAEGTFRT